MCNHNWNKINDVSVCLRCGLTRVANRIIFDRKISNINRKRGKKNVDRKIKKWSGIISRLHRLNRRDRKGGDMFKLLGSCFEKSTIKFDPLKCVMEFKRNFPIDLLSES